MKRILSLISVTFVLCADGLGSPLASAQSATPAATPVMPGAISDVPGLVVIESANSVQETMDRLQAAVEEQGFIVVARIDHAANAASVDQELRPTQLLIFGNPEVGTGLMQSEQTVAIDLPQKFLVWEAEDGTVYIAYNDPAYLAERHGLDVPDEVIGNISNALAMLAEGATAP